MDADAPERHSPDSEAGMEPIASDNFNLLTPQSAAQLDLAGHGGKADLKLNTKLVVSDTSVQVQSGPSSSRYRTTAPGNETGAKRLDDSLPVTTRPVRTPRPSSKAMAEDLPKVTGLALCDRIVNISVIEVLSPWAFWVQFQSKDMDLQDLMDKLE